MRFALGSKYRVALFLLLAWPRRTPKPKSKPVRYVTPQSLVVVRLGGTCNSVNRWYLEVEGVSPNPMWLTEDLAAAMAARDDYRRAGRRCSDVRALDLELPAPRLPEARD